MKRLLLLAAASVALAGCVVYDPAPGYYAAPGYSYSYPSYSYGAVVIDRGYYGPRHRHHWRHRHHHWRP